MVSADSFSSDRKTSSRGNVLFLILIAVALFAALTYAITQTGRGGGTTGNEQASMIAARLIDGGAQVATAVTRLRLNGCTDSQINFAPWTNAPTVGAAAAAAPANHSCDVFNAAGGGVPVHWLGTDIENMFPNNHIYFVTGTIYAVQGVGTDTGQDIYLEVSGNRTFANGMIEQICADVDTNMGIANSNAGNIFLPTDSTSYDAQIDITNFPVPVPPVVIQEPASVDTNASIAGKAAWCIGYPASVGNALYFDYPVLAR